MRDEKLWQKAKGELLSLRDADAPLQLAVAAGVLLFVINAVALPEHLYHSMTFIDIPAHILFGVAIWAGVQLILKPKRVSHEILFAILVAIIIGSLWEAIEYTRDLYAVPHGILAAQRGWEDTVKDMTMNSIGSVLAYLYSHLRSHS